MAISLSFNLAGLARDERGLWWGFAQRPPARPSCGMPESAQTEVG
jgi:hypothetical protein